MLLRKSCRKTLCFLEKLTQLVQISHDSRSYALGGNFPGTTQVPGNHFVQVCNDIANFVLTLKLTPVYGDLRVFSAGGGPTGKLFGEALSVAPNMF